MILKHKELGAAMKLALIYETTNRVSKIEDDRRKRRSKQDFADDETTLSERVREARWMSRLMQMLVQQSPQNDEMKMDDGTNVVMFVVDVR
jgi:hypothetical protein